jgi:hypothetical protein
MTDKVEPLTDDELDRLRGQSALFAKTPGSEQSSWAVTLSKMLATIDADRARIAALEEGDPDD